MPCRINPGGTHGAASKGPNTSALSPFASCLLEKLRAVFRPFLELSIESSEACRAHKAIKSFSSRAGRNTGAALDAVL